MNRRDVFFLITLCAVTTIIFGYFSLFYVDIHHDFIMFKPAVDVARGKMLFRDTFIQHGALTTLFQAAAIKIFGEYLAVIRLTTVLFYVATVPLLYLVWRRFLPTGHVVLSVLFWIALAPFYTGLPFQPWSSVYAAFFQSLTLLLFLLYCEREWPVWICLSGISAGLTFWARTPVGVFLTAAIVTVFFVLAAFGTISWKKSAVALFYFFLGVLIGITPIFVWLTANGALGDWWLQTIMFGREFAKVTRGISMGQLLKSLLIARYWKTFPVYGIWLAIPFAVVYLVMREAVNLWEQKEPLKSRSVQVFGSGLMLLASWMQYYPVPEDGHFFWAVTPMIGFFIYVIFRHPLARRVLTAAIVLFFLVRILSGVQKTQNAHIALFYPLFLAGLQTTQGEAAYLTGVSTVVDNYFLKHPEKTYINLMENAYFSMLNPHYRDFHLMYVNWPMIYPVYPDYEQVYKTYIQKYSPALFTRTTPAPAGYCEIELPQVMTPPITLYAPCSGL